MELPASAPDPVRGARAPRPAGPRLIVTVLAALSLLAGALAVTGAAGAYRYVQTFWLYRGFAAPRLAHSVTVRRHGQRRRVHVVVPSVQTITVTSPALDGFKDRVIVVLPPGYASHPWQYYPVLYLLHGYPGQPSNFLTVGDVADIEATLVAQGKMAPLILVIPTGTRAFLSDEEWANNVRPGNDWETFVARDLVKAIDGRYRALTGRRDRGLAGLSEGGYGALNIGLHHPSEFGLLESWSGYMQADLKPALFDHNRALQRYNSPADWAPKVASKLRSYRTDIWFYCGSSDGLAVQDRAFAAELTALGIRHTFFEHPGRHDWSLWRALMPQALMTASELLGHG